MIVKVRTGPNSAASIVKKLNTGAQIEAKGRTIIDGDLWFHISDGWLSGDYVQGWVKDYNDNNRWWYVEKGYKYPVSTWKTIVGKDYCFGKGRTIWAIYLWSAISSLLSIILILNYSRNSI